MFEVGDSKNIHLWLDSWDPFGVLYDRHGYKIIYDSQGRMDATLDFVLWNGRWCWKPARFDALVDVQSKLLEVHIGVFDKPFWTITRNGNYICAAT